jgi:5-methylcytosine-specific restriction endonuclease McrA
MKHILVEYKGGKCVECGYDKCEGSLQFHHLDGKDKGFTLSAIKPNKISMDELRAEADKCILLCANCHIKKHEVVDKVAVIMNLPADNDKNYGMRNCKVCDSKFIANTPSRGYCYECSPPGLPIKDAMRIKKRAVKHELLRYKGPICVVCGYDEYEGALHLHHRDPKEKEFTFSDTPINDTDFNMDRMRKEADKCDVLCANCHFEAHYKNDDDLDD